MKRSTARAHYWKRASHDPHSHPSLRYLLLRAGCLCMRYAVAERISLTALLTYDRYMEL